MKIFLLFAASALSSLASAEDARRPNVIVILADDLGFADVGFNGCKDIPTPHIDSLAQHGVRCVSGYVSHPFCSPTRAGLLTGRYQHRFGHENNPAGCRTIRTSACRSIKSLDVFATTAALAGAQTPPDRKMDSVNILPHLLGEVKTPPHDWLHWRTGGGATWAAREGNYKLVMAAKGELELFDLKADISEKHNLAAEMPDLVEKLMKGHDAWNSEMIAPRWESPRPPAKKNAAKAAVK